MHKLGSLIFVIAFASSMFAAERRKITVVKSLKSGTAVDIVINEAGKLKDMTCDLSVHPCQQLTPGDYIMVGSEKGIYQDCVEDVDIYSITADGSKTEPLGTYCLLQ